MTKIALCFLISNADGRLHQSDLWRRFCMPSSNDIMHPQCKIYVHSKHAITDPFLKRHARAVAQPIRATRWGHVSLVQATLKLLEMALSDDAEVTHVALLSESCIPLHPLTAVLTFLGKANPPRSILDMKSAPSKFVYRHKQLGRTDDGAPFVDWDKFKIQSQWMILCRADAQFAVDTQDHTQYFQYMTVPDEHYFVNVLHKAGRPFTSQTVTYTSWDCGDKHPCTFDAVTPDILKTARATRALFLRKVGLHTLLQVDPLQS